MIKLLDMVFIVFVDIICILDSVYHPYLRNQMNN